MQIIQTEICQILPNMLCTSEEIIEANLMSTIYWLKWH